MIAMPEVCKKHTVGVARRCRRNYRGEVRQLGSLLGGVGVVVCVACMRMCAQVLVHAVAGARKCWCTQMLGFCGYRIEVQTTRFRQDVQ